MKVSTIACEKGNGPSVIAIAHITEWFSANGETHICLSSGELVTVKISLEELTQLIENFYNTRQS